MQTGFTVALEHADTGVSFECTTTGSAPRGRRYRLDDLVGRSFLSQLHVDVDGFIFGEDLNDNCYVVARHTHGR